MGPTMNLLREVFSHICGQQHCWVLGGMTLPLCERCTGLYVGAFFGLILVLAFRPRPRVLVYWIHGWFMLIMLPFGFHLVAHGGLMRTVTGALFAFGLVYYLALNPLTLWHFWGSDSVRRTGGYLLMLALMVTVLLAAICSGGIWAAWILTVFAVAGAFALLGCAAVNVAILPRTLRILRHPAESSV